MIAKYYEYNYTDPMIDMFVSRMNDLNYSYYASELLHELMQSEDFNMDASVRKALAIMRLTDVPVQKHFACIYRSDSSGIRRDWKLSELACSLIIISSEPTSSEIEEMQFALMDYLGI